MSENVSFIYMGLRENMVAEVGAFDPTQAGVKKKDCKYLVMPVGKEDYDPSVFTNKKDATEEARYLSKIYNVQILNV